MGWTEILVDATVARSVAIDGERLQAWIDALREEFLISKIVGPKPPLAVFQAWYVPSTNMPKQTSYNLTKTLGKPIFLARRG